jgi:hypothetical protein
LIEILKKLRSNSPEWFDRYVAAYEAECGRQFTALLTAPPESLAKQQGVMAAYHHHLELLKQAK